MALSPVPGLVYSSVHTYRSSPGNGFAKIKLGVKSLSEKRLYFRKIYIIVTMGDSKVLNLARLSTPNRQPRSVRRPSD